MVCVTSCYLQDKNGNSFDVKNMRHAVESTTCTLNPSVGPNVYEEKTVSGWSGVVEGYPIGVSNYSYRYYQKYSANF